MAGQPAPRVPSTISDEDYARLQDRAVRTQIVRGGMFTPKAIKQRKAAQLQATKAGQS